MSTFEANSCYTRAEEVSHPPSEAEMEGGVLVIRYSTVFPKFAGQRSSLENRDVALAESFTKRYEIWLVVHSLLHYQDQQRASDQPGSSFAPRKEEDPEMAEERERQERVRIAVMSALFAAREVQMEPQSTAVEI